MCVLRVSRRPERQLLPPLRRCRGADAARGAPQHVDDDLAAGGLAGGEGRRGDGGGDRRAVPVPARRQHAAQWWPVAKGGRDPGQAPTGRRRDGR